MPVATSYPGVYIEEVSSGVRTITGVATSITSFLGRAARGPVNRAVAITSFAEYERIFGGLDLNSTMSFAVRDFYTHGGREAVIVRLFNPGTAQDADSIATGLRERTATADIGIPLLASSPGSWGQRLRAFVPADPPVTDDAATRFGLKKEDLFHLIIAEDVPGARVPIVRETFLNLTTKTDSTRRIDRVLEAQSLLVRSDVPPDGTTPSQGSISEGRRDYVPFTISSDTPDGADLTEAQFTGSRDQKTGLFALETIDLFNILCIPPLGRDISSESSNVPADVLVAALSYCAERRAMLIVDPPAQWNTPGESQALLSNPYDTTKLPALKLSGLEARNAAIYFPWVKMGNPLRNGQEEYFPACGIVAGRWAQTDATRGVWKAPAGIDVGLLGVTDYAVKLTDLQNGRLNPVGINCLRSFPAAGKVIWGARTLRGDDQLADEYKYIPVRRLALFLEESLYRGTQFAVFEPNDEPLWAQLRLNIGAFMHGLFRQGAFQGRSPREAYLVKCDKETTTQNDINLGRVNVLVGFAPLKPAEFVIIQVQQLAGQIQV